MVIFREATDNVHRNTDGYHEDNEVSHLKLYQLQHISEKQTWLTDCVISE